MLARQLGETFFNEKLNAICIVWLKDSVFSVREAALAMFKQVAKLFGDAWVVKFYLPALMSLQSEISYLHRLTVQFGMV
jgi:serine/threonine-protein phosphatase 2A regulatory subunit A